MTLREFENGYWYLDQLKDFAERIGIPAAKKLRKDELEKAIEAFLRTGRAELLTKRSLHKEGVRDVERGLSLKLRIENYTSNRETKDFIVKQARAIVPEQRCLVSLKPLARGTDRVRESSYLRRSRPSIYPSEQHGKIREDPSRPLHQLHCRVPGGR